MYEANIELEASFEERCATFCSAQSALHACVESITQGVSLVPTLMAVTAPPDALSAVLRAGGMPCLLDIDEDTLQVSKDSLLEVIGKLDSPYIVLLHPPAGQKVDINILELVGDSPVIVDYRVPFLSQEQLELEHTHFSVFSLPHDTIHGAVLFTKYDDLFEAAKEIRSGVLGLSAMLDPYLAQEILWTKDFLTKEAYLRHYGAVCDYAKDRHDRMILFGAASAKAPVFMDVDNLEKALEELRDLGFDPKLGVYPLTELEQVSNRFQDDRPSYKTAYSLMGRILAV